MLSVGIRPGAEMLSSFLNKTWVLASFLLLVALFVMVGCDGNPGAPGKDAPDFDHRPPEIRLLNPTVTTELIGDTVTFYADAWDTLGAIESVEFRVNGSSHYNNDSAFVFEPPYRWLWNFALSGTPYGYISIQALATDTAGLRQETPLFFLNRELYTGADTLRYFNPSGEDPNPWRIPDSLLVFDEDGVVTGEWAVMDRMGTRFTSRASGELREVQMLLRSDSQVETPSSFWIILYRVETAPQIGTPLDSIQVLFGEEFLDQWISVDLSSLDSGDPYRFEGGHQFVLALRLDQADDPDTYGLLLASSYLTASSENPAWERGYMHTDVGGWQTIGEFYVGAGEYRPFLSAVMEYDNPSAQ